LIITGGKKEADVKYPLSVYAVGGSQAPPGEQNSIYVMKWCNLHKTRFDDDSEAIDEEDVENDEEPIIHTLSINHDSVVNRIRSMNNTGIVAVWSENGFISLYNTTQHLENLYLHNDENDEDTEVVSQKPQAKVKVPKDPRKMNFIINKFQHDNEGYALQWSPLVPGKNHIFSNERSLRFWKL
jgi:ribosome assembly protein RRB1